MGLVVVRPGFRHVRVCVVCDERISDAGACKCSGPSPFARGAAVTVCSDAAGEVPLRISKVQRIGNGAFRLESSVSWYAFDGSPKHGADGTWVRPVRDGDEAVIFARTSAETRAARLATEEKWLASDERDLVSKRAIVGMHRFEMGRAEAWAGSIHPSVEGEKARVAAERAAVERIYSCLFEAVEQRDLLKRAESALSAVERRIAQRMVDITKIKAETPA